VEMATSERSRRAAIHEDPIARRMGQRCGLVIRSSRKVPHLRLPLSSGALAKNIFFSGACPELQAKASNSGILVVLSDSRKVRAPDWSSCSFLSKLWTGNCS